MKHFLLSWYGISDLRAALIFDTSVGPLFNALRTGDFTDAIILAYTDPSKVQVLDERVWTDWEERLTAPVGARRAIPPEEVQQLLDLVSNTAAGHDLFVQWLRGQLAAVGVAVNVQLISKNLAKLNDAQGILDGATTALQMALSDPGEKSLTTYVSPGTPVMAYSWALIARSNPHLKINVISNSDPRSAPEQIELPRALLNSSISAPLATSESQDDYDLVIHLMGEQTIPVLFGLRQFGAKRHIILTTQRFEGEARRLSKLIPTAGPPVVVPDPFKPADTRKAINKQVSKLEPQARVAVNMTGGTKLMFAGALSASWECGLDPFYFELRKHNVIFLRDGTQQPFVGVNKVSDFFDAENFKVISNGLWPDDPLSDKNRRQQSLMSIWQRREVLRELYKSHKFAAEVEKRDRARLDNRDTFVPFKFEWSGGTASLDKERNAHLTLKGSEIPVCGVDFFDFLAGGWLEEFVYSLLKPLEIEGVIRDVRVGLEAGYPDDSLSDSERRAQEFDCAFTDGKRLWIVECKAGPVRQEAIQKLENNLKLYGGVAARGLLISSFPLGRTQAVRVARAPSIAAIDPANLSVDHLRLQVLKN